MPINPPTREMLEEARRCKEEVRKQEEGWKSEEIEGIEEFEGIEEVEEERAVVIPKNVSPNDEPSQVSSDDVLHQLQGRCKRKEIEKGEKGVENGDREGR